MKRTNLIAARHEQGWSQEYLAEQIGVDYSTIQRWEHGETTPHPRRILQLCQLFGKTAQELDLEHHPAGSAQNAAVPEDTTGETSKAFRASDLTMRLFGIVWKCPCGDARYEELQRGVALELEEKSMNVEDPLSRRDAMRRLALMAIEYCSLSALQPVYRRPVEDILSQCAAGITGCWYLSRGKDLAFASEMLAKYLPTLQDLVKVAPSEKLRQSAAELTAQCLILSSSLVNHLENGNNISLYYAQQAELYSKRAGSLALQIRALNKQSISYDFAYDWKQALAVTQEARALLETNRDIPVPPLLVSSIYASLADYQGHTGKKDDVRIALNKAHATFFAHPPNEATPVWAHQNEGDLLLRDGLAHFHLELYKEAIDSFTQISKLEDASETTRVEAFITQVQAEVRREDAPRNMESCIANWQRGIQGAITLQSDQWFRASIATYDTMRAVWPTEKAVKNLREQIIHW